MHKKRLCPQLGYVIKSQQHCGGPLSTTDVNVCPTYTIIGLCVVALRLAD